MHISNFIPLILKPSHRKNFEKKEQQRNTICKMILTTLYLIMERTMMFIVFEPFYFLLYTLGGLATYSHCSSTPDCRGCALASGGSIFASVLAKIEQILIQFVYMRDQEKKRELQTFIQVLYYYTSPNLTKWTSLWKISS